MLFLLFLLKAKECCFEVASSKPIFKQKFNKVFKFQALGCDSFSGDDGSFKDDDWDHFDSEPEPGLERQKSILTHSPYFVNSTKGAIKLIPTK